jgi:DNA-binding NarL/FixJ family response regulator
MSVDVDWKAAAVQLHEQLNEEERRIVQLLAEGHNRPHIAATMGLHRSAVWRKIQKIRERLPAHPGVLGK